MTHSHLKCSLCVNRKNTLFKCLDDEIIDAENFEGNKLFYPKNSFLFKEGDNADYFYCIKSGEVRTYKNSETGKELTFQIKSGGDWTGCRDLVLSVTHNHSSICLTDVYACAIPKDTLEKTLEDPHFQHELLLQMAKSWRDSEQKIFSLGTKQVHSKLAEFLLVLYNSNGRKNEISVNITREIMATIIGSTTESLIRALSDFKHRHWIDVQKNKIHFIDINALHSIAEIDKQTISY